MFWKLALTLTVVLMALGRSGPQRNILIRLLLPREWAARLIPPAAVSATPTRSSQTRTTTSAVKDQEATAPPQATKSSTWGDRAYLLLVVTAATAVTAWIVTHALITTEPANTP